MILDDIAAKTRIRVEQTRAQHPLAEVREQAFVLATTGALPGQTPGARFEEALLHPGLSFICEVKQASPSAGQIAKDFDHLALARAYEQAGADAISVLTEPDFFKGENRFLAEISASSPLPTLRKDFVIDEYQLFEARLLGASAVLLIVALLADDQLLWFIHLAAELGLASLVEAHSANELERALAAGAQIVGINNRDLSSFTVDLATTEQLRALVPEGITVVGESGIRTPVDAARMYSAGVDAVLIGEALVCTPDIAATLTSFRNALASAPVPAFIAGPIEGLDPASSAGTGEVVVGAVIDRPEKQSSCRSGRAMLAPTTKDYL
jgi:indole-3-glycerol phosphate synthase